MSQDAAPAVGTRSSSARHVARHVAGHPVEAHDTTADPPYAAELSVLLRLLAQVRPAGDAELVSLSWDRHSPPPPVPGTDDDSGVRLEATVTRLAPGADPSHAMIHQAVHVMDDHDRVRARSSVAWSAPTAPGGGRELDAADFASVRWGARVRERLAADDRFAPATRSFDGTIAFAAHDRQVHFRIYRGAVIEVARRSLSGATFTVEGTDLEWARFLTAPTNDFIRRANDGGFRATGSGYQYLRMIKAIMIILDHARALARGTTTEATGA
ncbi:hypothetical protein [Spongiactinospora sp. TRM90649]|uniref:hypothetical protein n=1 Tax=Spongiactinospora sp. TRM90649 TaxID=3031114 RepID=UPI0023F8A319|nr:hypothetical protein [Spongiactinospora sp. TRM90649]MDF5757720.1 hypothetical protein [Spongiactinospora sp. TRM90649]